MRCGNRGLAAAPTETPKCHVLRSFSSFETFSSCDREKTDRRTDYESARRDKMGTRAIPARGRWSTVDEQRPTTTKRSFRFETRARDLSSSISTSPIRSRFVATFTPINSIVTNAYANVPNFPTKFNLYRSFDALKYWLGN